MSEAGQPLVCIGPVADYERYFASCLQPKFSAGNIYLQRTHRILANYFKYGCKYLLISQMQMYEAERILVCIGPHIFPMNIYIEYLYRSMWILIFANISQMQIFDEGGGLNKFLFALARSGQEDNLSDVCRGSFLQSAYFWRTRKTISNYMNANIFKDFWSWTNPCLHWLAAHNEIIYLTFAGVVSWWQHIC